MTNILKALNYLANNPLISLLNHYKQSNNRINSMGDALELYIQDLFTGTLQLTSPQQRNATINQVFSYFGNKNNPPDLIIRNGDALEIKKIESATSTIALNSSYPKKYLYADDTRITPACKQCENWRVKDIIYCIGYVTNQQLKHLWFIYGDCYAADREVYNRIANAISSGINMISDIDFAETNELGRVNKVDPLGVTSLRIRGMWQIINPAIMFDYIYKTPTNKFGFSCLMKSEKFTSFPQADQQAILSNSTLIVKDTQIQNPDNPANLLNVKLQLFP